MEKSNISEEKLLKTAFSLSIITIVYNLIEGLVSIYFGIADETLVLFGFGLDSFVETISASGIAVMIYRMLRFPNGQKSKFEKTALQITGACFYLLSIILIYQASMNIYLDHKPQSTVPGIIISILSIFFMYFLIRSKTTIGNKLHSKAILADANCGKVCVYMSIVLLISTILFEVTGIGWIDSLGSLGLTWFSIKEGKEAFEKARGKSCHCDEHC